MKIFKIKLSVALLFTVVSCNSFIDVIPDNIATLEYAFRMRSTALRYLATCYSFMPTMGHPTGDIAQMGGDELWINTAFNNPPIRIARGGQNVNSPLMNFWDGTNGGSALWTGISQCNIFLENIGTVPDMDKYEIRQWAAEIKVLKAYYHFELLRMYGPIPVMRENLPISASGEEVRVHRQPVDDVFNYIVELIDEATGSGDLPDFVFDENTEYGRITLPIALGFKARVLIYAASPLFNGNTDYNNFRGKNGVLFFNQTYDVGKWEKAAQATKSAIDFAEAVGHKLYEFVPGIQLRNLSDTTLIQLTYRGALTERWNSEIIWANPNATSSVSVLQRYANPRALDASMARNTAPNGVTSVPLKIVNLFYTQNGVPIEEDHTWHYNNRFDLWVATEDERYNIKQGYTTAALNFHREHRFYAALGFDGGIWYGSGKYDDNDTYWYEGKMGQYGGKTAISYHSVTGYYPKKQSHYTNTIVNNTFNSTDYPWVMLRLTDLYLMYAEAMNEAYGPSNEVYHYLNILRERAGLPTVQNAWANFSRIPTKYTTQDGLRDIIHRERAIELAFEGHRFWDLRRWKTAVEEASKPISGWDVDQASAVGYYRERLIFKPDFSLKDYFQPISEQSLLVNKNLTQNVGW